MDQHDVNRAALGGDYTPSTWEGHVTQGFNDIFRQKPGQYGPGPVSTRDQGTASGGMGFFPFLLLVGPGYWVLAPVWEFLSDLAEKSLPKYSKHVAILFGCAGAAFAFLPQAGGIATEVASIFEISYVLGQSGTAVVFFPLSYWLGGKFVELLAAFIQWLIFANIVLLTFAIYLAVLFAGYYIYLNVFDGTEIPFLTGLFDLIASAAKTLFGWAIR